MYPETVTVTGLPSFATHNRATADFTFHYFTDLSKLGEYLVRIKSEIRVPTDFTNTTFTIIKVEYEFPIRVQPCLVATYKRSLVAGSINHAIRAPEKNFGAYSFSETPICNYPTVVTVTDLPTFASHKKATSDFTINYLEDLNFIGEYVVTIKS